MTFHAWNLRNNNHTVRTEWCEQGGVLLSLLWGLVVDDILWELANDGYYMEG
jgi:hypothetical protein